MASRFKHRALAGMDGAAAVAWFSVRKPGAMHRRDYRVGQTPCCPISVRREQLLAAATEGSALTDNRQLKV